MDSHVLLYINAVVETNPVPEFYSGPDRAIEWHDDLHARHLDANAVFVQLNFDSHWYSGDVEYDEANAEYIQIHAPK